jgi:hypothetical protein
MPDLNIDALVDQQHITEWQRQHVAASDRLTAATTAMREATVALTAAKRASERAVDGHGDIDPLDAEHAVVAAQRAVDVAIRVFESATAAHKRIVDWKVNASGKAWAPVYLKALRDRVAACRKHDQARALLAEAEADAQQAEALAQLAHENGAIRVHMLHVSAVLLRPEAEVLTLLRGEGADLDAGTIRGDFGKPPYRDIPATEQAA